MNDVSDPFQLDRLAKELADRESDVPTDPGTDRPQFPDFLPLSHNNVYLVAKDFDVENFLLSRSYVSLSDLRTELREYLAELKKGLIQLINDEYEAFISLSTDLKNEGNRLCILQGPTNALSAQVLDSRCGLNSIQDNIRRKLRHRAILREENALLHLLLRISESIARLESLLLIPPDQAGRTQRSHTGPSAGLNLEAKGNRHSGRISKHLSRAASEYIQLLYHANKAKEERCAFFESVEWRIQRIYSTISSDLDHVFATTLTRFIQETSDRSVLETEAAKNLTDCLKTYDTLGLWRLAEQVLRREVVRTFVQKEIYHGALVASHSPIIPLTPFSLHAPPSSPTTPYIPMTPYVTEKDSFKVHDVPTLASPYSRFLEETEDPLARLFTQTLRFIERDLTCIMDLAENISQKSSAAALPEKSAISLYHFSASGPSNPYRFEILANVIWEELGTALMDELGSTIFSSGQPEEFKRNFEISQAFVCSLEWLSPSLQSLQTMRCHPIFEAFQERWQLPVYFQMRCKEIITKLEVQLAATRTTFSTIHVDGIPFASLQASSVWAAVSKCWSADVFLPQLSYRFWKLTLQILSRYNRWLEQCMQHAQLEFDTLMESVADKAIVRSATPVSGVSAEQNSAEDAMLQEYSCYIIDIKTMRGEVLSLWHERIWPSIPTEIDNDSPVESLQHVLSDLSSLIKPLSERSIRILSRRCSDALLPVRSIPSQFRAMTNKHGPSEPSYFVPSILRPLKDFFAKEGPGKILANEYFELYASETFDIVVQRYVHYLTAMRKTEESLRRLKKGKKNPFSLFKSGEKDEEDRDEARIQAQMILDVEAFQKDAESLGIVPDRSVHFKSLKDIVRAIDVEEC